MTYRHLDGIAYFCLFTFAQLMPIMSSGGGESNIWRQLIYVLILLTIAYGTKSHLYPFRLLSLPLSLGITIAFCWLSVLWAIDPGTSVRRLILTTIVVLGVFTSIRAIGFDAAVKMATLSLTALLAISFVMVFLMPSAGIHQMSDVTADDLIGSWRGIFGHKNYAGPGLATLIMMLIFYPVGLRKYTRPVIIFAALIFLYKTQSKTSMALLVIATGAGVLYSIYSPRYRLISTYCFLTLCVTIAVFSWLDWDAISAPFSSPDSFTGRVQIWPAMVEFWQEHELGAGFGSFWNISGENPILAYVPATSYVTTLSIGHNGYLDLLVTIGPIGIALSVISMLILPIVNLLNRHDVTRRRAMLLIATLIFCCGHNMTETSILDRDSPVFVVWLSAIALLMVAGDRLDRSAAVPRPAWLSNRPRFARDANRPPTVITQLATESAIRLS